MLIDVLVGPYDPPDAIEAEIRRIEALEASNAKDTLDMLREWLKEATN
jgi:hypothetical protein